MKLRNKGAEYRRSTGDVVRTNEVFTPGEQELQVIQLGRMIGIRFEEVKEQEPASIIINAVDPAGVAKAFADEAERIQKSVEAANAEAERLEAERKAVLEVQAQAKRTRLLKDWDKKVSPEEYLQFWPNGPRAALARDIVAVTNPTGATT